MPVIILTFFCVGYATPSASEPQEKKKMEQLCFEGDRSARLKYVLSPLSEPHPSHQSLQFLPDQMEKKASSESKLTASFRGLSSGHFPTLHRLDLSTLDSPSDHRATKLFLPLRGGPW